MEEEKYITYNDDTFEMRMKKVGSWFNDHISIIFAFLIAGFYILNGAIQIIPTTMGIKEQIISAIINIIAGLTITSLVGEGGFKSAKSTSKYLKEVDYYNQEVQKGLEWRLGIENLAKEKAENNLKNYRRQLLESVGLRYSDLFDNYGHFKTEYDLTQHKNDKNYRRKKRMVRKAITSKIYTTNVFGRASSSTYGLKKETSEKEYRTRKGITKTITKLIFGVASVGVMFAWLGFTLGAFIYAFMQIVIWTGMGLMDRQKNFNFIIDEIVPQYESNRLIIQEFMKMPDEKKKKYMPSDYLQIEMKKDKELVEIVKQQELK